MRVYDRDAIRAFLLRDVELHIYELGDLDPQFFPRTRWYGAGDPLEALCLVYDHPMMQSLLALCREAEVARTTALLAAVGDALPDELYLHHSPGVVLPSHVLEDRGRYDKMRLVDHDAVAAVKSDATPLGLAELPALDRFYERCYPDNWFDPRMIETGASPRASLFLTKAAKANAFLQGRSYATPHDVKNLALDVLRHRVAITYEAEAQGRRSEDVIERILAGVLVP